jgi:hypothetical protein
LSKTWNVAKPTSGISSSPRKISCFCEGGDAFADASLVEAHAPPAIERDMPANPKAGKTLLRRLPREECFGMAQLSDLPGYTELTWRDEIRPSWFQSRPGMTVEAMPSPAAVKPLAKREADFSDD